MNEKNFKEEFVAEVRQFKVIADRYIIDNIETNNFDSKEYEMAFEIDITPQKYNAFDTRKILIDTYRIGELVTNKFIYQKNVPNSNKVITINVFVTALHELSTEFQGRMKDITSNILKKLNITLDEVRHDEEKKKLFYQERTRIQHEIYLKKLQHEFNKYKITEADYKELLRLIRKWIKSCGISKEEINLSDARQHIFPIIQLGFKIYNYIENYNPTLKYSINYITTGDKKNPQLEPYFETIDELIYYIASGYVTFKRGGFITCKVCGKLAIGKKTKLTCSEKCKKIYQRYNRNK